MARHPQPHRAPMAFPVAYHCLRVAPWRIASALSLRRLLLRDLWSENNQATVYGSEDCEGPQSFFRGRLVVNLLS